MTIKLIERNVTLTGLTDLMFDAFRGQKDMATEEKLYYLSEKDRTLVIPSANISSFLSLAGDRASRYNRTGKPWTELQGPATSCILIRPPKIPILREGKPIVFEGFGENGVEQDYRKTGGSSGGGNQKIPPEMKYRPVVQMPWCISFIVALAPNEYIDEGELRYWFEAGGIYAGLGNGRKIGYGKFEVNDWS